jgi:hypothetical protein
VRKNVLKEYCKTHNKTIICFAKEINLNYNTLYHYNEGLRLPNVKNMKILTEKSNGEINYYSFVDKDNFQPDQNQLVSHLNQSLPPLPADFNPYASETMANQADLNTSTLNDIAKGFNSYVSNTITPDICLNSCITKIDASLTNLDPSTSKANASLTDLDPSASNNIAKDFNLSTSDAATPGTCSDIDIANIDPDITNPKIKEAVNG